MRNVLWGVLLFSLPAFAQNSSDSVASDNVASEALRKRVLEMNLLNPPKRITLQPPHVIAAVPRVCAIPLLEATPPGTGDRLKVVTPPTKPLPGDVIEPMPPCNASAFRIK
jgi:hypothetical protein